MQNKIILRHNTTYGKWTKQNGDFSKCFWTELQFKPLAYVCSEWLLLKNGFKDNLDLNQVKSQLFQILLELLLIFDSEETKILSFFQYLC